MKNVYTQIMQWTDEDENFNNFENAGCDFISKGKSIQNEIQVLQELLAKNLSVFIKKSAS